jgi:vesicle coat complex subunit
MYKHIPRKYIVQCFHTFKVVANAVAALSEIAEQSPQTKVFDLNGPTINKLLTALNECTEWGQVFILDAIANYSPKVR